MGRHCLRAQSLIGSLTHCVCAAAAVVVQARKNAGIGARAKVEILAAEQDMYVSRTTGE